MSLGGVGVLFFLGSKLGQVAAHDPERAKKMVEGAQQVVVAEKPVGRSSENGFPPLPGMIIEETEQDVVAEAVDDVMPPLPPLPMDGASDVSNQLFVESPSEVEFTPSMPSPSMPETFEPSASVEDIAVDDEQDVVLPDVPVVDDGVDVMNNSDEPALQMLPSLPDFSGVPDAVIEEEPAEVTPAEPYVPPPPVSEEEVLMSRELEEPLADDEVVSPVSENTLPNTDDVIPLPSILDDEVELVQDDDTLFGGLTEEPVEQEDPTETLLEEVEQQQEEIVEEMEVDDQEELDVEEKSDGFVPYDPTVPLGEKNYKTQSLPEPVHSKHYDSENKHLPEAVEENDYYKMFFIASGKGDLKGLHALRQHIEDIDRKDVHGNTALIHAVLSGNIQSIRFLLANNADPDVQNNDGVGALHIAASMNRPDVIQALKAKEASLYIQDNYGREPYIYAMESGYWGVLGQLVDAEFNPDGKLANGEYRLINAIKLGKAKYVAFLLKCGADPNVRDEQYYTSLMLAAYNGQSAIVEILLQYNADVYARDLYNRDAAYLAEIGGFISIAQRIATEQVKKTIKGQ